MGALTLRSHLAEKGLLDRFEERAIAWAEQAGIRWVELGGEFWTLVSELERKKGTEPTDFAKNARLLDAPSEKQKVPPAAVQRLMQVPGVRRASIPRAFEVEGGYALSCGGPGAKEGITRLVRQQIPEWALAGYTLVNVPLALAYLMHGRSEVAKATRDLTIGTTIDVGKAAAARENAPLAVAQFSDDESVTALLAKAIAKINASNARTEQRVDHVEADLAGVKVELAGVKNALDDTHGRSKWMKVCEEHGVIPPEQWLRVIPEINPPPASPGVYVILWSDPERFLYVGKAEGSRGLLGRLNRKHNCLRYLWHRQKEFRVLVCPTEFSGVKLTNLERALQVALMPDWEYGGRQRHWSDIQKAMAEPIQQLGLCS